MLAEDIGGLICELRPMHPNDRRRSPTRLISGATRFGAYQRLP